MQQTENIDDLIDDEFSDVEDTDQPMFDGFGAPPDSLVDDFGMPESETDHDEAGEVGVTATDPAESIEYVAEMLQASQKSQEDNQDNQDSDDRVELPENLEFKELPKEIPEELFDFHELQKYLQDRIADVHKETGILFENHINKLKEELGTKYSYEDIMYKDFESAAQRLKDSYNSQIDELIKSTELKKAELPPPPAIEPNVPSPTKVEKDSKSDSKESNQEKTSKPVESKTVIIKKQTFGVLSFLLLVSMLAGSWFFSQDINSKFKQKIYLEKDIQKKLDEAAAVEEAIIIFKERKKQLEEAQLKK